ncbi:hypothetical protein [Aliivibrio wodanis]|uniref:hypothetical protein n=1 Tax=Aliivibrio wodanis TaxID=80852 RepID=UPI00406CBCF4
MRELVIPCKNPSDLIIQLKAAGSEGYNVTIQANETELSKIIHNLDVFCKQSQATFYVLDMSEQLLLSESYISNIIEKVTNHERYNHLLNYITELNIEITNPLYHSIFRLLDIICRHSMTNVKRHHIAILHFNESNLPMWGKDIIDSLVVSNRFCFCGIIFVTT